MAESRITLYIYIYIDRLVNKIESKKEKLKRLILGLCSIVIIE